MAVRAIRIAEQIVRSGCTVTIRWSLAHKGVEGNERADQAAKEVAELPPLRATRGRFSLAYLGRGVSERTTRRWMEDTRARMSGSGRGAFRVPDREARPGIRPLLGTAKKRVASRFFQLLSGHAMIAPFLKERWGWTDTDKCWWCEGGRQSRGHLFKECKAWEKEIRELWMAVGSIPGKRNKDEGMGRPFRSRKGSGFHVRQARARPGSVAVRELLLDGRYTGAVLGFLEKARVGKVKEGAICR